MTAAAASPTARVEAAGLYERLGVPPSANATEIGRAYRALVRQYTPERSPDEFARIREAYELLSDPATRRQYDARPEPEVDVIAQAQRAVQAREHETAVRICKQALLSAPDRHDVRALLGFCLLQQGLYDEAIVQLERVVTSGAATAPIMARLGDAYRAANRYAVAEGWYRSAMIVGGDEAAGYSATLADMLVARGDLARARVVLESCLPHVPADSSLAFKLMARIIDIAVQDGKRKEVARRLADVRLRAARGGTEGEAAVRLGELAWQLIEGEHFRAAFEVAQTAVTLKPRDPIYDALERLAAVLSKNDLDAAERLLWTHVTFAPRGPLESRRVWVEWYCKALAVCKGLRPAKWAPPLKAVAGCGFKLRARRSDDGPSNSFVATCWLHVLGLPLVGLRTYRVRTVAGGRLRVVGHAPAARPAPAPATRKRGGGRWIAWVVGLVVVRTCAALVAGDPAPSAARQPVAVVAPLRIADSLTSPEAAADAAPPEALADYRGIIMSDSGSDTARLVIGISDTENVADGTLAISGRAGWIGPVLVGTKGAYIVMLSGLMPDTLQFFGTIRGDTVSGTWRGVSGARRGQRGTWLVRHRAGLRLPLAEFVSQRHGRAERDSTREACPRSATDSIPASAACQRQVTDAAGAPPSTSLTAR